MSEENLRSAIAVAARMIAGNPDARARVEAVHAGSPVNERAGAYLLGVYRVMTHNEAEEITAFLEAKVAGDGQPLWPMLLATRSATETATDAAK